MPLNAINVNGCILGNTWFDTVRERLAASNGKSGIPDRGGCTEGCRCSAKEDEDGMQHV